MKMPTSHYGSTPERRLCGHLEAPPQLIHWVWVIAGARPSVALKTGHLCQHFHKKMNSVQLPVDRIKIKVSFGSIWLGSLGCQQGWERNSVFFFKKQTHNLGTSLTIRRLFKDATDIIAFALPSITLPEFKNSIAFASKIASHLSDH
jgi:hypothetical protein